MDCTFFLERILRRLVLGDVDYAVDVERDFLGVCAPVLVVEAVRVLSVFGRVERVVTVGYAALVDLVAARGSFNLRSWISPVITAIDFTQVSYFY